ncbi:MAG: Hsp20/alpha crystallin family protein [Treponema sp.]|jgi:HSP20 family protein|nr:Hsp20/alpha crystallin family protein [Treponema sp.]
MKAVSLYRPVSIEKAMNDFNHYLESFFDSPLSPLDGERGMIPAVDVRETDAGYLLEAELPGFDEKDIQVHVDGGNLTIESAKDEESKKEENKKDGNYLIRERRRTSFSRSFRLPENADTGQVAAVFKNGVLSLEIKKRAESQKRLIKIDAK